MPLLPNLSQRCTEPELMDAPDGDRELLFRSLDQFHWINRLLTPTRRLIHRHFIRVMRSDQGRTWHLLDVGAGGCDLPIWLAEYCRQRDLSIEITCLDYDRRVIEYAERKCARHENVTVLHADALRLEQLGRRWDFVFTNHFLHHLSDAQVVAVLRGIYRVCDHSWVLSDIARSYPNFVGFTAVAAIFLRNSFSYHDGRLSIRKGFTAQGLRDLVRQAELPANTRVKPAFPGHLAIVGQVN